ncbi:MAG: hypothetical protein JKP98_19390 [Rhodobacteraceae bacterium]|nr:hypothetical protein [Paracoccaceae bacterium]
MIGILTAGAVLLTFESVRQYGVSLPRLGRGAGLVLALAARRCWRTWSPASRSRSPSRSGWTMW